MVKKEANIKNNEKIKVGDILVNSIGCGCSSFYKVISSSNHCVVARQLNEKYINVNQKLQTAKNIPVKDSFLTDHENNFQDVRLKIKFDDVRKKNTDRSNKKDDLVENLGWQTMRQLFTINFIQNLILTFLFVIL